MRNLASCKGSLRNDRNKHIEHSPSCRTLSCSRAVNCPRATLAYCCTSLGGGFPATLLQNTLDRVTRCARGSIQPVQGVLQPQWFALRTRSHGAAWFKVPKHGVHHESLMRLTLPRNYFATNLGAEVRVRKSSSRASRRCQLRRHSTLPR